MKLTLNGTITVYHFSKENADSILLDPIHSVTRRNYYSNNDYKLSKFPRIFYYTDLKKVEHQITTGKTLYYGTVDGSKILMLFKAIEMWNTDKEFLKKENSYAYEVINSLKGDGYTDWDSMFKTASNYFDGVYYDKGQSLPIINMFVPVRVLKYE